MKPKLILQPGQFTSFTSWYLDPLWRKYFDIEIYSNDNVYSKNDLFVCWFSNVNDPVIDKLLGQGHKVVADHLWEYRIFDQRPEVFYLTNKNWFWYNEAIWWHSLNYHCYVPRKQIQKLALMPIRQSNPQRDRIVAALNPLLHSFLYSYKSKTLPNDIDPNAELYQRYFNPEWYDQTFLSLVVETFTDKQNLEFITEKTFKPMAFYHPFMIVAAPGHLKYIQQRGFATFDNLFDESYDQIESFDLRLSAIIDNLKQINVGSYDAETLRRLEHNHHHFFNQDFAVRGIEQEIVEPLLHYAET